MIIIFERKLTTHSDLELINNNDDLELNNMQFEETDDKVVEDLCWAKNVLKKIVGLLSVVRSIVRFSWKSNIIKLN